jgi:hypothetical protein
MHTRVAAVVESPNDAEHVSKGMRVTLALGWAITATLSMFAILGALALVVLQNPHLSTVLFAHQ